MPSIQTTPIGVDGKTQLMLFAAGEQQAAGEESRSSSDEAEQIPWSEEDVVQVHWRLLLELRHLPDAGTPLEEKIDALNWVFTEQAKEGAPFSFIRCIAAVTQSPLSQTPYFGTVDADEIKRWIRCNARRWMRETVARYPQWVQQEIYANPDRALRELDNNPRWINEELRARSEFGDFFV